MLVKGISKFVTVFNLFNDALEHRRVFPLFFLHLEDDDIEFGVVDCAFEHWDSFNKVFKEDVVGDVLLLHVFIMNYSNLKELTILFVNC